MTQNTFTHWIENIFTTQEHEIDCHQLQRYLPAFVEAKFTGDKSKYSAVISQHLRQCPDCDETYQGLRLVTVAEFSPVPASD
ncbi:MAG: hypothetical protein GY796_26040 [Chloroflexi bacterium]|nr:hypothetical protein [Chloroflexota bacterium]